MQKSHVRNSLSSYDEIFSTEESRADDQREKVIQLPIDSLVPFQNHPFRVVDNEDMRKIIESIQALGVVEPLIAREIGGGQYEIISGHRRQYAAQQAGIESLPVIIRNLDDDAATILMVDSNLHREEILPSERAFAYKMKLDAIKHQGKKRNRKHLCRRHRRLAEATGRNLEFDEGYSRLLSYHHIRRRCHP